MMQAKTMCELVAEHRDQMAELTQQIGELNIRVNQRDHTIELLMRTMQVMNRKASHGCCDANCDECDEGAIE
jgi:TolA-binding protein